MLKKHATKSNLKAVPNKKISEADHIYLLISSKKNRRNNVTQLTDQFDIGRKDLVSKSSIRRALQRVGMNGRVGAKKPLLRAQTIVKRLKFAKDHVDWTHEQWGKVLFTDESKFEIF